MDMDWKDVAAKVVSLGAPMLGSALGGPLGGMAGKVLADAFGAAAATPEAVHAAISDKAGRPEDRRGGRAKGGNRMDVGACRDRQAAGERSRPDDADGGGERRLLQRWWRPLYALELSLIECPAFALTLLHALWNGHEAGINGLANLSGLLMTYFGARFGVLGVYVSGRTREKQTAVTGEDSPSVVGTVLKAVARRR